jgi:hypothetical protein
MRVQFPMAPQRRAAFRALLVETVRAEQNATEAKRKVPAWRGPVGRRVMLGLGAVTAVGAIATIMLAADPAAPASYAGWSALPLTAPSSSASHAALDQWESRCEDLAGNVALRPPRKVLTDQRGGFTYCLTVSLSNGLKAGSTVRAFSSLLQNDGGGVKTVVMAPADPVRQPIGGDVSVLSGDQRMPPLPAESTSWQPIQMFGLAGPDVTGVDVVLSNGLRITATVHDGVWAAWWPSTRGDVIGRKLEVHTRHTPAADPTTTR